MIITRLAGTECHDREGNEVEHGDGCVTHVYQLTAYDRDPRRTRDDIFVATEVIELPATLDYAANLVKFREVSARLRAAGIGGCEPAVVVKRANIDLESGDA